MVQSVGEPKKPAIWGAIALALLAYAGQIKGSPYLAWLPIDLTLLLGVVSALAVATAIAVRRVTPSRNIGVPLTLFFAYLFGVFGSSMQGYANDKVTTLFTITLLAAIAPFFILRERRQQAAFLVTLTVLGLVVALVTLVKPTAIADYSNVSIFAGTNTIGTARMTTTALVICVALAITARTRVRNRLLLVLSGLLLITVAIGAGSRGPFLAVIVGLGLMVVTAPGLAKYRGRAISAAIILGAGAVWWISSTGADGFSRVFDFLNGQQDNSTLTRSFFWAEAWKQIPWTPWGVGWGDFWQLRGMWVYAGADGSLYPHNLVTEVFIEGGWLLGAATIVFLLVALVRSARAATDAIGMTMYALVLFAVFNAMVSGDINDSRLMWMLLSVALILPVAAKRHHEPPLPKWANSPDLKRAASSANH